MKSGALHVALFLIATLAYAGEIPAFRTDILPILTRAGCNTGACHGAASGQGGFKLSLLGYDPEEDHARITRELGGRRIDVSRAGESLLLRKASDETDHEGGRKLNPESAAYATVRAWIAAEAPFGPRDLHVTAIAVKPTDSLLGYVGEKVDLKVTATLSDGTQRDVTAQSLFTSNDDAIAAVTKSGEATSSGHGLTSITVRYSGQVAAARIAVPFPTRFVADFPARNFIDGHILTELERLHLSPSEVSTDSEFLRRVFLDVIGLLPTPDEIRDFTQKPQRDHLVDSLLARTEFTDYWTMHFADLLLVGAKGSDDGATRQYHEWLRDQIANGTPLNSVARTLLTATGDTARSGPPNFYTLASDPRDMAEHVGRIFLGTQIGCARCHAHPSDRWTQDDYHAFAACFSRVTRNGRMIEVSERGDVLHPKTGRSIAPKPLGAPALGHGLDRRIALAEWLTSPENSLFSRSIVNRVWKHLLGRGLVEPVDDLRPTNPPTHPALLDALSADFVAHQFDLRHLVRTIVNSRTYQLSSTPRPENRADDRFYSRAQVRELPAAVYLDAIAQAAEVPSTFPGYSAGTRAVQLVGARTPSNALDLLGRCSRERPCDSRGPGSGSITRALHLINGDTIQSRMRGGLVDRLLAANATDRTIITDLYLRALSRPPAANEEAEWLKLLGRAKERREAVEDLLWTLLNSREFAFNH